MSLKEEFVLLFWIISNIFFGHMFCLFCYDCNELKMPKPYDYEARNKIKSSIPFTITNWKQDIYQRNDKKLAHAASSNEFQFGIGLQTLSVDLYHATLKTNFNRSKHKENKYINRKPVLSYFLWVIVFFVHATQVLGVFMNNYWFSITRSLITSRRHSYPWVVSSTASLD